MSSVLVSRDLLGINPCTSEVHRGNSLLQFLQTPITLQVDRFSQARKLIWAKLENQETEVKEEGGINEGDQESR